MGGSFYVQKVQEAIQAMYKACKWLYSGFYALGLYFYAKCNITAITQNTGLIRAYAHVEEQLRKEAKERQYEGVNQYTKRVGANLLQGSDKKRNPKTAQIVSKKIGVSENTYNNMKKIVNEGTEEQIERMDKRGKHINSLRACEGVCKRFL